MLKLKRFDNAVWFEVPEFKGVSLCIKPATFSRTTKLLSSAKRKVKVDDDFVDIYDDGDFALSVFKEVLVDFKGIEIDKSLTKDEQKEIIYEYEFFRNFVGDKSQELYSKAQEELDEDLKNSKTSQAG